jgi:predicted cupin superfamily sugar epimerase/alkylhydroperoxidase family enzyme
VAGPGLTPEAAALVQALALAPHPEGGFYRETYRAAACDADGRAASTCIYFLLPAGHVSHLHRIDADEGWHWYRGGALEIHELDPAEPFAAPRVTRLGSDVAAGAVPQHVVPAGRWFGARLAPGARYALVGCTVAPGFEFERFELGVRDRLLQQFPRAHSVIEALTPAGPGTSRDATAEHGNEQAHAQEAVARAQPRIAPLTLAGADSDTHALLSRLTDIRGSDTRLLNVFGTLAQHPELLRQWLGFATYLLRDSTLPPRLRELVILRVGWLCRSPYEWGQHVHVARRVGVDDATLQRLARGSTAADWSPEEAVALRAAEEIVGRHTVSSDTWATLASHFDTRQVLDLVFVVGQYQLVCAALNACRVERDDGLDDSLLPFPTAAE